MSYRLSSGMEGLPQLTFSATLPFEDTLESGKMLFNISKSYIKKELVKLAKESKEWSALVDDLRTALAS